MADKALADDSNNKGHWNGGFINITSEGEESLVSEPYDMNDEIEFEQLESNSTNNDNSGEDAGPYSSEPFADDEWLREYY